MKVLIRFTHTVWSHTITSFPHGKFCIRHSGFVSSMVDEIRFRFSLLRGVLINAHVKQQTASMSCSSDANRYNS